MLDMPDEVYNWTKDYFENHSHCTKFQGLTSSFAAIVASVFQGSGIGPAAFVVNAGDLHPVNTINQLMKYADDTYLIVPSAVSHSAEEELEHIEAWSKVNNLKLNPAKSMEIIFAPRRKRPNPPNPVNGIKQVEHLVAL